jgi:lysophospholipase L1-like esterase
MFTSLENKLLEFISVFPPFTTENANFYIYNFIIVVVLFYALKMINILTSNKNLARRSSAYKSAIESERKILILGDSTAVGTGADRPEDTIAGMLAHDFPKSQIINLGKNGAVTSDLIRQVKQVTGQKFDMVIISIGGNDCWSLISRRKIGQSLEFCFKETKAMSNGKVIFLMYNNIGSAPIFPFFVQLLLKGRIKNVQDVIYHTAQKSGITLIDLFNKAESNPFQKNPTGLFAKDGIHPSSAGYRLWYTRMWRKMREIGFVYTK